MWRITAEGRRLLKELANNRGGRAAFGIEVGIGKNQVKPILDDPDHRINNSTLRKLCDFCEEFQQGEHYVGLTVSDGVDLRLARDRKPERGLSKHDQRGIETLYNALYNNPRFHSLRLALDSPADFQKWFAPWIGASEDLPSEQFFVYRLFRDKVISFLLGERHLRSTEHPVEIFVIWYLVGVSNAFYDGSPVELTASDEKELPLGERETAAGLTIRLLEELRQVRSVNYLLFEVEAEELHRPDSYGRLLFRIYSHAEEDVRRHFASDVLLSGARFFVLGFPYMVPRPASSEQSGDADFTLVEHRLVCCPLFPNLRAPFISHAVPSATVRKIVVSLYQMYWDYFDADSPKRTAIQSAVNEAMSLYDDAYLLPGRSVPVHTLRDFINSGFKGH